MVKLGGHIIGATMAILIAAGPTQAQKPTPNDRMPEQAERALKEGLRTILRALETMFKSVPQYEMPEVLENGDIIIRRKKPKDTKSPDDTGST
ncbi:MAG: hypothetical protein O3C34_19270 [Proteobacteria bacterium]|nr:hypothetical protein [Pseudomonadota bacterium]